MLRLAKRLALHPHPILMIARAIARRTSGYERQLAIGSLERPYYAYCVHQAAKLALRLQVPRISVIEYGVAGGVGLVNLEYHAREISKLTSVEIEVYGFDTGEGLPAPVDYRDLPYHWEQGFYRMDVKRLEARLEGATLVLGKLEETGATFFEKYEPAPIGAIAYDLDYYSSTMAALQMLEAADKHFLPRIHCFFDDVIGSELQLYSDHTGVRLAINEFNRDHDEVKFSPPYHLRTRRGIEQWYHQIWISHRFHHPSYNDFIGGSNQQAPLT